MLPTPLPDLAPSAVTTHGLPPPRRKPHDARHTTASSPPSPPALAAPLIILCALLCPSKAAGSDLAFGGEGGCLIPINTTYIKLLSEDVTITALGDKGPWRVLATYLFQNPKSFSVDARMALPERHCAGAGDCATERQGRFADLKTTVRGVEVPQREGKVPEGRRGPPKWVPDNGRVWMYDVTFKPRETLEITQRYTMDANVGASGMSLSYLARPSRLWRGAIGKATFTIRLPSRHYTMRWPRTWRLRRGDEKRNAKGALVAEYVFEMRNWKPLQDLRVHFGSEQYDPLYGRCPDTRAVLDAVRAEKDRPGYLHRILTMRSDDDLRLCRHRAEARHGRPFASKALRRFFYGNKAILARAKVECGFDRRKHRFSGMTVNKAWSEALLSDDERTYSRALDRELQRRANPN